MFFTTGEKLASDDNDTGVGADVYQASGGTLTLVSGTSDSAGSQGATFAGASADGSRVLFTTTEPLNFSDHFAADMDVWQRSAAGLQLISNDQENVPATFGGASADGTRVFFMSQGEQVDGDGDTAKDVYQRFGGNVTWISRPGGADIPADYAGASADGTRVFFTTSEGDNDGARDIYERSAGVTTLISGDGAGIPVVYKGASADGTRVFFETAEKVLTASDPDTSAVDVYERSSGTFKLISGGSDNAANATFAGASADGTRVFFETTEQLLPAVDTDSAKDVYERSNGTLKLVTPGGAGGGDATFRGASSDGSRVFFHTLEPLVGDGDGAQDVFQSTVDPQCADGIDNDGDGGTDFPIDPGCGSGADDSESPDPFVPPAQGGSGSSGGSGGPAAQEVPAPEPNRVRAPPRASASTAPSATT